MSDPYVNLSQNGDFDSIISNWKWAQDNWILHDEYNSDWLCYAFFFCCFEWKVDECGVVDWLFCKNVRYLYVLCVCFVWPR